MQILYVQLKTEELYNEEKTIIIPTLLFVVGIIGAICVIVLWDRSDSAEQLKFEYEKGKSGVIVTGFTGEPKAIIIPDEIDGYPVTEIGYNAFFDAMHLRR